jgi:S-DNA-T family DNA segregation ATPase FtsK/SpoIIIE
LSELIGSQAFEDQNMALPLILGKNISGDPVIADLAPMPHCWSPARPDRASRSA